MHLEFSPTQNVLAAGQITGAVRLYSYDEDNQDEVLTLTHHTDSVRQVRFNPKGSILYASSADKSFSVISNGRVEGHLKDAHDEAINALCHIENDCVIATGDDDGIIKVWDLRDQA